MLPGIATLKVWGLPPEGVNTAEGLEVNKSSWLSFCPGLGWWEEVFRFLEGSQRRGGRGRKGRGTLKFGRFMMG